MHPLSLTDAILLERLATRGVIDYLKVREVARLPDGNQVYL